MKENQIPPTYSSLNFFTFLSVQFSNIKKCHHSFLRDLVHIWTVGWCITYSSTWIRLLVFIPLFLQISFKFQNIKFFVTLFSEAYKVETWYTHGQRVDLLCTPNTNSQNILVTLFFFFFLSLQLAKINDGYGVCELCSLSAVFYKLLVFCVSFKGQMSVSGESMCTKYWLTA